MGKAKAFLCVMDFANVSWNQNMPERLRQAQRYHGTALAASELLVFHSSSWCSSPEISQLVNLLHTKRGNASRSA